MQLTPYSPSDYADAQRALLPPGAAFDWPQGGFGDSLLVGIGEELARIGTDAQMVLDRAIEQHRLKYGNWHFSEYIRVANEAIAGAAETLPRRKLAIGCKVGQRMWSSATTGAAFPGVANSLPRRKSAVGCKVGQLLWSCSVAVLYFPVELLRVELMHPFRVGCRVGDRLWSGRGGYVIRVRYYSGAVNPKPLWDALSSLKQAHVYLWFEDITGAGGNYGQN